MLIHKNNYSFNQRNTKTTNFESTQWDSYIAYDYGPVHDTARILQSVG